MKYRKPLTRRDTANLYGQIRIGLPTFPKRQEGVALELANILIPFQAVVCCHLWCTSCMHTGTSLLVIDKKSQAGSSLH